MSSGSCAAIADGDGVRDGHYGCTKYRDGRGPGR